MTEGSAAAVIDLRTDFVSRPTEAMVQAMMEAARAPASFGLRDDPKVAELEALAAHMLGKDDALFVPTCGGANQIAIHVHCRPGEAIVAEADAHIITSESGAHAALSGTTIRPLPAHPARPSVEQLHEAFAEGTPQRSRAALLWLENTHVRSGGTVHSLEAMDAQIRIAREHGASVHLDGSRIFNAAAFLGVPALEVAKGADSVSVSMNKGLAAPMGAILAGSRAFIKEATRVRQMFGGGWRPANIPAAAAIVGLRTMVARLHEDHHNARSLALALGGLPGLTIDMQRVQTNILLVHVDPAVGSTACLVRALASHNVLVMEFSTDRLRLVTWHEIGPAQVQSVAAAFAAVLAKPLPPI